MRKKEKVTGKQNTVRCFIHNVEYRYVSTSIIDDPKKVGVQT